LLPITGTKDCRLPPDPLWCRTRLPAKSSPQQDARPDDASEQQADHAILCATCGAVITHRSQALRIDNQHEHAFFNPAGIAYALRCFRDAPGVSPHGEPIAEFTWFPGYCWQIVLCASCQTHLGWRFTNTQSFFGLIGSRLV
jgi:hypothetical protein